LDLEPPISCVYAHPLCVIRINIFLKKPWKKGKNQRLT
jgi:hypothetical protein